MSWNRAFFFFIILFVAIACRVSPEPPCHDIACHPLRILLFDLVKDRTSPGHLYTVSNGTDALLRMDDIDGNHTIVYQPGTSLLGAPLGLAYDSQNRIYIASQSNNCVVRIDDMSGAGYAGYCPGIGTLNSPVGVAIDGRDRIYIADSTNNVVLRINDISGAGLETYSSANTNGATGIALDWKDRIYFANGSNQIVRIDDISGTNLTILTFGSLVGIAGIAFDKQGGIYATSVTNDLVARFADMASAGEVFFNPGTAVLDGATGLWIDPYERMYVGSFQTNSIVEYDLRDDSFRSYTPGAILNQTEYLIWAP